MEKILLVITRDPAMGPSLLKMDDLAEDRIDIEASSTVFQAPLYTFLGDRSTCGPFAESLIKGGSDRYLTPTFRASRLNNVTLLGHDGVLIVDGKVLPDTVAYIPYWLDDSLTASFISAQHIRLKRELTVTKTNIHNVIIGFTAAWKNYSHWMEECLPKLISFLQMRIANNELRVVLPQFEAGSFQQQTVDLLDISPAAILSFRADEILNFRSAYVLTAVDRWRIPSFCRKAGQFLSARASLVSESPLRLYVRRSGNRRVENFSDIEPVLRQHGFQVVSFEVLSLTHQLQLMDRATHVVVEHGSGAANLMFVNAACAVLELFNPHCVQPAYRSLSSACGFRYGCVVGDNITTESCATWNSDYIIPYSRFVEALELLVSTVPTCGISGYLDSNSNDTLTKAKLEIAQCESLTTFVLGSNCRKLTLWAAMDGSPQLPLFRETELPNNIVDEHYASAMPPAVSAYAIHGFRCWGNGLLVRDQTLFLEADVLPEYFDAYVGSSLKLPDIWAGAIRNPFAKGLRVQGACAIPLHPNLVYGHFLLEVLPRFFVLSQLRALGLKFSIAISSEVPAYLVQFLDLFFRPEELVRFDWHTQYIEAETLIVPSMMHQHRGYHPTFNLMVEDTLRRAVYRGGEKATVHSTLDPGRIYLSRTRLRVGWHSLQNEIAVENLMQSLGFRIVHPQELTVIEQILLFSRTKILVGEYSSALHNAMFCPVGTSVVAINRINWYQSAIGRMRQQNLAFVAPLDGRFRDWRSKTDGNAQFEVDVECLADTVNTMLDRFVN